MEQLAFKASVPCVEGIYQALAARPKGLGLGQLSNFVPLTSRLYEPLWRHRSLSLLTRGDFSTERELALMLDWVKPSADEWMLDAACSAGLYARTLLKREPSLNVHAVDFSLPFLKRAKQYAERDNVAPVLVLADVSALPYKDSSFHAVVCGGSLNEFLDVDAVQREFARVLKPEGRLWHMYLSKSEAPAAKLLQGLIRPSGIRFIDPKRLEAVSEEVGLRLEKAAYRGVVSFALFRKL